ncbi:8-oxo-dGTP diphosphatase MutT [Oceanicoccus sagamiensis]|uniref:8-oxo-dGTP diphosphatase n=1 Tax=Oceanicoccus sagamiensis TaxID=716816 RepID=A0A1X9NGU5_9GAMM|nr:8-oxo-dGTP diphosphatase MutT [Oceanicoccus sagamiensis]ARN74729.1 7,8-dihydro-8-oxoguanine-triphosphatase [Oceanicoccus sagamiensis]
MTANTSAKLVHVAVGVIVDSQQNILIALRPEDSHQGGLWEFPGGKVEKGETVEAALSRELNEELGLTLISCRPLIEIRHDYPDKSVLLDVWWVDDFTGQPEGKEGQPIQWVSASELSGYTFPAANTPIIHAVQVGLEAGR